MVNLDRNSRKNQVNEVVCFLKRANDCNVQFFLANAKPESGCDERDVTIQLQKAMQAFVIFCLTSCKINVNQPANWWIYNNRESVAVSSTTIPTPIKFGILFHLWTSAFILFVLILLTSHAEMNVNINNYLIDVDFAPRWS